MLKLKKHINTHFHRFLLVGSFNTLLDLALFFLLANLLDVHPVISSFFSTSITMLISFQLNHSFVFNSQKSRMSTIGQFLITTAFNVWLIQSLVISIVISLLHNFPLFYGHEWSINLSAKLLGVTASFILNFLVYRTIFHERLIS